VSGPLKAICPDEAFHSISEIDLVAVAAAGKKLILLDVDNTLLPWRSEDIPQSTRDWIEVGRTAGLEFCILSNTRNVERLDRLAKELGIQAFRGKFKPSREMFRRALREYQLEPKDALMIGDQLFTDILGANRTGIETMWVKPMASKEFVGTKVSRMGERLFQHKLYQFLDPYDDIPVGPITGFLKKRIIQQFLKFCVVGALSTVIDLGVHFALMFWVRVGDTSLSNIVGHWGQSVLLRNDHPTPDMVHNLSFGILKVPAVALAILNSFYWNRRWTFEIKGKEDRHQQLVKFVTVALIGMGLNVAISTSLNSIIPGHAKRSWAVASLIAMVIVVFWNFFGQRLWTFRKVLRD